MWILLVAWTASYKHTCTQSLFHIIFSHFCSIVQQPSQDYRALVLCQDYSLMLPRVIRLISGGGDCHNNGGITFRIIPETVLPLWTANGFDWSVCRLLPPTHGGVEQYGDNGAFIRSRIASMLSWRRKASWPLLNVTRSGVSEQNLPFHYLSSATPFLPCGRAWKSTRFDPFRHLQFFWICR